jgi:putative sugar O-methyltransferase
LPIKIKHLLHPLRTFRLVKERLAQREELLELVRLGKQRFSNDPRYLPAKVPEGFAWRNGSHRDDSEILDRICTAYIKAVEQQRTVSETFHANQWWQVIYEGHLGAVTRALAGRDIDVLGRMYRNFFRDPCGAGLTGLPFNMPQFYLRGRIRPIYRHLFLSDALHRLDLWNEQTNRRFELTDLASLDVGNPFGLFVEGVFIRTGAEYQHYYAHRVASLLGPMRSGMVGEIGGGFGGMAYYLIRDNPKVTYINFDMPETIALASYYLLKCFPALTVTLYGERDLSAQTLKTSNVVMLPAFELPKLPASSLDVSFDSHVLADMSSTAVHEYMDEIARTTRGHFLHLDRRDVCLSVADYMGRTHREFVLVGRHAAAWNMSRSLRSDEIECLYSVRSANDATRAN